MIDGSNSIPVEYIPVQFNTVERVRTDLLDGGASERILPEQANAFDQALTAALSIYNETNETEKLADIAQIDFATGKNNDILRVIMAEQKAASSLELTVQLTNKVIEAYREIMRIQL